MIIATHGIGRSTLALAAGLFALAWNGTVLPDRHGALLTQAEARIGRPLTPMSYAGVARRTTRRAVAVGAAGAVGAGAYYGGYGGYYGAPGCMQVVNGYGQIVYSCP
jgi:hypothetical protein